MWKLFFIVTLNTSPMQSVSFHSEFKTKDGCEFAQKHLTKSIDPVWRINLSVCIKGE